MTRALIVGGGISGLSCAWFLRRQGVHVTVLEAEAEVGGNIRSLERDGFLIESGPNSTQYRGGALGELIQGLALDGELIDGDRRAPRYIVKDDRLLPLPLGPLAFLTTPLFSIGAKLRLLAEPFQARGQVEESIAQFVRRRLGAAFLDWAVDPFVSGVYAGDPERLSARAATARLYALEAEYGSLFLGALQCRGGAPARLISFKRGMQTLPRAIAQELGDALHVDAAVTGIARAGNGEWVARTATAEYRAERLVLALPAHRAAALMEPLAPDLARELAGIFYPPVASVALGFARAQVRHPLDGFGALLPRRAQRQTLGVIFSSSLFAGRAPVGQVLLTAFIGGAQNPSVGKRDATMLVEQVLADLRPLLGVTAAPALQHVTLWPQAIPQYELGHQQRLARIDAVLKGFPRLQLGGNWRDGVSLADSVSQAKGVAENILRGV
ncbi:MAG: protoporphyrinogen oxidase [Gammaproteobacteria bacterium]|nr:protoporphyrinogen oxidase [Gammaproteobacteria bacterium]